MPRLNVLVRHFDSFPGKPCGTTYIRLLQPLNHPIHAESLNVFSGRECSCQGMDVVIVERRWREDITPQAAAALVEQVRQAGACLIYTLDDNLLDWSNTTIPQKAAMSLFAREADGMMVSTYPLKERFKDLNSRIHVVPNAIDERLFSPVIGRRPIAGNKDGRQVIGYMGTKTHDADAMMIADALRSVLRRRRGKVELQLIGAVDTATLKAFTGLPVRVLNIDRGCSEYLRFVPWMIENMFFDVGIAPLQRNDFNDCKSDIKFLDYSALGIPGIYSYVPAYQETVRHLETGYLAENTREAWEAGLERMLDDHTLRQSIAANAQKFVFANRSLEHCAQNWQNAIQDIREQHLAQKTHSCTVGVSVPGASGHGADKHAVPDVDLIMGVHNQPNLAVSCIESILANTSYPRWRLLIVDDHSDDVTRTVLEKYASQHANIQYHRNEKNLGFIGTYNRGIALSNSKYMVFTNSDIIVSPGWLEKLVAVAESDPSVALVNPLSNRFANLSLPMVPGMSFLAMNETLERQKNQNAVDIVTTTGYCLLVRREAIERHGCLDEIYGQGYCEDKDLHMRLTSNGWRAVAATNAYVYHLGSGTFTPKGRRERLEVNEVIFRQRWGERADEDLQRFLNAAPLNSVHALFVDENPLVRQRRLGRHWLHMCKKAVGYVYRHRDKLAFAAFHPRYTAAVFKKRLKTVKPPCPPLHLAAIKLTSDYLNRHTRPNAPSVVFVSEGLDVYGGSQNVVRLVNQLILLGVEARVAVAHRKFVAPETLHGALFEPMLFNDPKDLMQNFPKCHIAIATSWTTAPYVQEIVKAGQAETSAYDLQDFEAWFYDKETEKRKVYDTYPMIEHHVVTSKWLRGLIAEHGFDAKVIPLGVDPFRLYPQPRQERPGIRIIAMARPETPRRGFENMVAAFRMVHRQRPDTEFLIYGTDALSKYGDLGFPYTDLGVIKDRAELCKRYNDSDIFVDPSHFQGFGLPALEAMACQVACVLTNVGGVHEYAKDGYNALMIPPRNPEACCDAVLRLLDNRELRNRLAANGRNTVEHMPLREEGKAWANFLADISPAFRAAYEKTATRQAAA